MDRGPFFHNGDDHITNFPPLQLFNSLLFLRKKTEKGAGSAHKKGKYARPSCID